MQQKIRTFWAILFLAFTTTAVAETADTTACSKVPGMIGGPMVGTPKAAREIYLAIAGERGEQIADEIAVSDGGDRWAVSHGPSNSSISVRGGGQLVLYIKKCDGSMSGHYLR